MSLASELILSIVLLVLLAVVGLLRIVVEAVWLLVNSLRWLWSGEPAKRPTGKG